MKRRPNERSHNTQAHTDHLGNAEAVFEVVERDVVVSPVDLKQELLQNLGLDVEGRQEIQVCVHELQEHHDLRILPLPACTQHTHRSCTSANDHSNGV